jgi:hypothetical protein
LNFNRYADELNIIDMMMNSQYKECVDCKEKKSSLPRQLLDSHLKIYIPLVSILTISICRYKGMILEIVLGI